MYESRTEGQSLQYGFFLLLGCVWGFELLTLAQRLQRQTQNRKRFEITIFMD